MIRNLLAMTLVLLLPGLALAQIPPDVARLCDDLKDGKPRERIQAALGIAKKGKDAELAVPALVRALKDQDADVRSAVLYALGQLGPIAKNSADDVVLATKDKETKVRLVAVQTLGELKIINDKVLTALMNATTEDEVGPYAINAIGTLGPDAADAVPALARAFAKPALRQHAAWALGKIGKKAMGVLGPAMKDQNVDVRIDAVLGMALVGEPGLIYLEKALESDPEVNVRLNAANGIGKWGAVAKDSVPCLITALQKDKDDDVKVRVAQALGRIGPDAKKALPALQSLKNAQDSALRDAVNEAITRIEAKE